ncbi:LuxR C-terminal-related transcriptional regulator [Micromonospora sp. NPDC047812]|uniref:response regulator transcription factor n=1 Tax=Micromonospora sp. NPDC047812 TaxID=3155742 RepID=UPI003453C6FD
MSPTAASSSAARARPARRKPPARWAITLKDAPPEELAAAVRAPAAGRSALAPAVARRLMGRLRAPGTALSRRETEVLQLVADGLSNQQISRRLHPSPATVKTHLVHVHGKLGVDSRTAVAAARARGLIRL